MKIKWVWLCMILGILAFAQPQTHPQSAQMGTFAFTVEEDLLPKENVAPFHEILSPITFVEKHERSSNMSWFNWSVVIIFLIITLGISLMIHHIWKKEDRKDE